MHKTEGDSWAFKDIKDCVKDLFSESKLEVDNDDKPSFAYNESTLNEVSSLCPTINDITRVFTEHIVLGYQLGPEMACTLYTKLNNESVPIPEDINCILALVEYILINFDDSVGYACQHALIALHDASISSNHRQIIISSPRIGELLPIILDISKPGAYYTMEMRRIGVKLLFNLLNDEILHDNVIALLGGIEIYQEWNDREFVKKIQSKE